MYSDHHDKHLVKHRLAVLGAHHRVAADTGDLPQTLSSASPARLHARRLARRPARRGGLGRATYPATPRRRRRRRRRRRHRQPRTASRTTPTPIPAAPSMSTAASPTDSRRQPHHYTSSRPANWATSWTSPSRVGYFSSVKSSQLPKTRRCLTRCLS